MKECKCTMAQSVVGDGCEICQPQTAIENYKQWLEEEREENAKLREELEAATKELLRDCSLLADSVKHWQLRAHELQAKLEAAEARIREAEKQEPFAYVVTEGAAKKGILTYNKPNDEDCSEYELSVERLYLRPIPSPDVAELQEFLRKEKIVSDNLGKIADSQAEKIVQLESQLEAAQSQIKALREAMAEQDTRYMGMEEAFAQVGAELAAIKGNQEPIGFGSPHGANIDGRTPVIWINRYPAPNEKLYTHPQRRLTDEEINIIFESVDLATVTFLMDDSTGMALDVSGAKEFARAIEAKLLGI